MKINVYEYEIRNEQDQRINYKISDILGDDFPLNLLELTSANRDSVQILRNDSYELDNYVQENPTHDAIDSVHVITREIAQIHQGNANDELEDTNTHSFILDHKNTNTLYITKHKKNKITANILMEYVKRLNNGFKIVITPKLFNIDTNEIFDYCKQDFVKSIRIKTTYTDYSEHFGGTRDLFGNENDQKIPNIDFKIGSRRNSVIPANQSRKMIETVLENIDQFNLCTISFKYPLANGKKDYDLIKENKCVLDAELAHNGLAAVLEYLYANRDEIGL